MLTTNGRNQLLDATDVDFLSLHTGFPGQTQANEVAGGSPAYARKGVTWAAAASGEKASSNSQVFDIPASTTVRWIGYSDAVTSGNGRGCAPNGGTPKEFQVIAGTDKIREVGHGRANDSKVVFYGGTAPGGLTEGTIYFVINAGTDDYEVSATLGGSLINLTSVQASGCVVSVIVEESFGAQGTFTLASGVTKLNLNQ